MIANQIQEQDLLEGEWYVGRGRNGNIARYIRNDFLVLGEEWYRPRIKVEPYYDESSGCFQPFRKIEQPRLNELSSAEPIPFEDLVYLKWYAGVGHRLYVGRFNGWGFMSIALSHSRTNSRITLIPNQTEKQRGFSPLRAIDEGRMILPFGKTDWMRHYGTQVDFDPNRPTNYGSDGNIHAIWPGKEPY